MYFAQYFIHIREVISWRTVTRTVDSWLNNLYKTSKQTNKQKLEHKQTQMKVKTLAAVNKLALPSWLDFG